MFVERTAVVTGAGSGIGAAIAKALAVQGARVVLVGRNQEKLDAVAAVLDAPQQAITCAADLTCESGIQRVQATVREAGGRLDILVHSLGLYARGNVETASVEDFDAQFRTNVRAPYALTQRLLPMMIPAQGQIVFINSSAGNQKGRAGVGQYAATKHALSALADSLREEVNPAGIRVLSVFPGRTATPMQAAIHETEGRRYRPERLLQPEDVASVVIHALGLPVTAEVTDIAIRPMLKG